MALTIDVDSVSEGAIWSWSDGYTEKWGMHFGSDFISVGWFSEDDSTLDRESFETPLTPFILRLAATWDSSDEEVTLYQNATAEAGSDSVGIGSRGSNKFFIRQDSSGSDFGEFSVGNVMIYDEKLSANQVEDDYSAQPWS